MTNIFEDNLKDFGNKLFSGLVIRDGMTETSLTRLETRLDLRLPDVLRRFYLLVGGHRILMRAHNRFLRPQDIRLHNNALIFLEQNQNVMFWGILLEDLRQSDPPVRQGNFEEDEWYLDANFLSAFVFGIVGWQVANGMQWTAECIKNETLLDGIRRDLTFLDPGVKDSENDLTTFYEKDLVVSISKSADKMLIGANQRSGLQEFEKRFRVSLDYL